MHRDSVHTLYQNYTDILKTRRDDRLVILGNDASILLMKIYHLQSLPSCIV